MAIESRNFVFGTAQNPWNPNKSVGGSTGGEGALIASRCSPLGIGSDIGGSIRVPAAMCGTSSLKPTSTRLSFRGHTFYSTGFNG